MITSPATTTSCTMMRTELGMVLRMREMMTLLKASTAITERPMTMAGSSLTVTASIEHMPRICTTTGLFLEKGLKSTFRMSVFSAMAYLLSDCR